LVSCPAATASTFAWMSARDMAGVKMVTLGPKSGADDAEGAAMAPAVAAANAAVAMIVAAKRQRAARPMFRHLMEFVS
jgi:hypothetical protein